VKDRRFRFPVSRPDDHAIPSGRPSVHCSIRPDDVSYRPDARHTKHHPSRRRAFSVRTSTVSRSYYSSLYPSGHLNSPSRCLSVIDQLQIFFKFKYGKTDSTVRTMWYPVRTSVSLRQESQFKYHRPDVSQPWSRRACN